MTFMKDNWCCDPSFVSKGIIIGHEIQMQMGLDTSLLSYSDYLEN